MSILRFRHDAHGFTKGRTIVRRSAVERDLIPTRQYTRWHRSSAAVLSAVGAGEISPDEAGRVMALLTAHKNIVETGDLERRIAALEVK